MSRRIDFPPAQAVVDRYNAGETIDGIAAAVGRSTLWVRRRLVEADVTIRPGKRPRVNRVPSEELVRRYLAGASISDLVKETNWSYGTVYRRLRECGVRFRPAAGPASSPASNLKVAMNFAIAQRLAIGERISEREWQSLRQFLGGPRTKAHAVSLAYQTGLLVVGPSYTPCPWREAEAPWMQQNKSERNHATTARDPGE